MIEVHLVLEQWGDGEEVHKLDPWCWCDPEASDGEWEDRRAVVVDHRPAGMRDYPHSVFLVDPDAGGVPVIVEDGPPPIGGTLPVIGPPGG